MKTTTGQPSVATPRATATARTVAASKRTAIPDSSGLFTAQRALGNRAARALVYSGGGEHPSSGHVASGAVAPGAMNDRESRRGLSRPAIPVRSSPVEVPYRSDMERAFGASFEHVTAYVGEQHVLASFGAQAAAWSETVAFAGTKPERDVVAHELAHIEQLRHARGSLLTGIGRAGDAAEVEAERIATAIRQGGTAQVRATARPSGAIAFAPLTAPQRKSDVDILISKIKDNLPALDSMVLTDEGRADLEHTVAAMIAQLDASHAVLSAPQRAIVDRARSLVSHPASEPADSNIPPPQGELLPPSSTQALSRVSSLARQTVRDVDNDASESQLLADAQANHSPIELTRWAIDLQSIPVAGGENYLRAWFFALHRHAPDKALAIAKQIAGQGVSLEVTAGEFTSLEHIDPSEPLPRTIPPEVASAPSGLGVDHFVGVHYDVSYRFTPGRLSTILQLTYADGARLDLDLYLISDNAEPASFQALSRAYIGPAGRLFPLRLGRDTTPRLWAAKQAAIAVMRDENLQFENLVTIGLAGVMSNLPFGPVVTPDPTATPPAPRGKATTATAKPPTAASEPPAAALEPPTAANPPTAEHAPPAETPAQSPSPQARPGRPAARPAAPGGWKGTLNEFGKRLRWPARSSKAPAVPGTNELPVESVNLDEVRKMGVDEAWARQQASVYRDIANSEIGTGNPSARPRSEWLERLADRLHNEPPGPTTDGAPPPPAK